MTTRRILIAEIMHETNTFNNQLIGREDFASRYWLEGPAVENKLKDTNTEIWGLITAIKQLNWTYECPIAASANPSGPLNDKDWQYIKETIKAHLYKKKFDAVVLVLHGAMVTESTLDAEGDLLQEVRAITGNQIPIAVTLDLHANVSEKMAAHANLFKAYKTYPHTDQYELGQNIIADIKKILTQVSLPQVTLARRPMLDAANHGQTSPGQPMPQILQMASEYEQEDEVAAVSIQVGFPWADVPWIGPSVLVSGTDQEKNIAVAEALADQLWLSREQTQIKFPEPEQGIRIAQQAAPGDKPFIMADFADNPAAGAFGDSPNLLHHMLQARLKRAAFATISDPESVQLATQAGVGNNVKMELGGKGAPQLTPPLPLVGRVMNLSDGEFVCAGPMWKGVKFSMGKTAVVDVAGIQIIISSVPTAVMDLNVFRSQGIDPEKLLTIGLKSRNHFKAAYAPIARDNLLVDAGGIASMKLHELGYSNIPRPIWPLDPALE